MAVFRGAKMAASAVCLHSPLTMFGDIYFEGEVLLHMSMLDKGL